MWLVVSMGKDFNSGKCDEICSWYIRVVIGESVGCYGWWYGMLIVWDVVDVIGESVGCCWWKCGMLLVKV